MTGCELKIIFLVLGLGYCIEAIETLCNTVVLLCSISICACIGCLALTHTASLQYMRMQWPKWILLVLSAPCRHSFLLYNMVAHQRSMREHSLYKVAESPQPQSTI
jgi:hypothetical protein